jgi:uncharacterized protein YndB with AHSA1/START domain
MRRLPHPVAKVWAALTQPEQLLAWWGAAEFDLVEGGKFSIEWLNTDEDGERAAEPTVMHGVITALDPPNVLEIEGDIHGTLRFDLRAAGDDSTVLTFSSTLEIPEAFVLKNAAGWLVHLDFLEEALAGGAVDWPNWPLDRWQALYDRYVDASG